MLPEQKTCQHKFKPVILQPPVTRRNFDPTASFLNDIARNGIFKTALCIKFPRSCKQNTTHEVNLKYLLILIIKIIKEINTLFLPEVSLCAFGSVSYFYTAQRYIVWEIYCPNNS